MTELQARENQIECRVEKMVDRLDRRFMNGAIEQAEYDREMVVIDKWAQQQIDALASAPFTASGRLMDY